MSQLTEDMYELLEKRTEVPSNDRYLAKSIAKALKPVFLKKSYQQASKPGSNDRYMLKLIAQYLKPIFQKKSYKRKKKS